MTRFFRVLLCGCCAALSTKAQEHRFGSWNSVGLQYDLNKKWSAELEQTIRAYPVQFEHETQWLTEVGIARELGKKFEITPGYRFSYRNSNQAHRLFVDLSYQERPGNFQFTDRVRYLYQWDRYGEVSQYVRNKLTVKYRKPKKLTPLIAGELFYRLGYEQNFIDQYRAFIGTDYKVNKQLSFSFQLMREQEIQVRNPMTTDVLQLGVEYEF